MMDQNDYYVVCIGSSYSCVSIIIELLTSSKQECRKHLAQLSCFSGIGSLVKDITDEDRLQGESSGDRDSGKECAQKVKFLRR